MKKNSLILTLLILFFLTATTPLSQYITELPVHLMVIEWCSTEKEDADKVTVNQIPPTDNSMVNPDYKLLSFHWTVTANYWINPSNKYGFSNTAVVTAITTCASTWDSQTSFTVFSYQGTTSRNAGNRDGYNVISWGSYRRGIIAVTYIWYSGTKILETDTKMNTLYKWSLTGETGKMDAQNIMTHELGHWCGLNDLYSNADYWLTMYGYSTYGETYKQTLGLGDINGLKAVYGP